MLHAAPPAAPQEPVEYMSSEEHVRRAINHCPSVWTGMSPYLSLTHVDLVFYTLFSMVTSYMPCTGTMALKADTAGVEMFYLCGNQELPAQALPVEEEGLYLLRIVQRMRLEKLQLEGVDRKMNVSSWQIPKLISL